MAGCHIITEGFTSLKKKTFNEVVEIGIGGRGGLSITGTDMKHNYYLLVSLSGKICAWTKIPVTKES